VNLKHLIIPVGLATTFDALAAVGRAAPVLPEVGAAMQRCIDDDKVSGVATLVVGRDGLVHPDARGLADIASGRPMVEDTLFWIASMTRPVTGVAVMMLVDEGGLSLADPVANYIPDFAARKTPSGAPASLTLQHVLTHTSGMDDLPQEIYAVAQSIGR